MTPAVKEWASIVGMLAISLFFYMLMPEEPSGRLFPGMMILIMVVLAVVKIGVQLMQPKAARAEKTEREASPYPRVLGVVGGIIVYIAVIESLGFYTSSFLFFLLGSLLLQKGRPGPKDIAIRAAVCFGFCLFLYLLFSVLLLVQIPKGILI